MGKKTGKGGAKIGDNSPNVGKGRKVTPEEIKRRNATRARNTSMRKLRDAAQVRSGTIQAGTGSGNNEVSDEAILNMARNIKHGR